MEDVMLAANPKFRSMIEESRKNDKTLTAAEVRARIARRAKAEAAAAPKPARRPKR